MKKQLTIAFIPLLVLTMAGCGSSSPAEEPQKEEVQEEEIQQEEPEEETVFQLGTVENGVYKNTFFDIGFKLQEAGMHEMPDLADNYRTKIDPDKLDAWMLRDYVTELVCQNFEKNSAKIDDFNVAMTIEVVKDTQNQYEPVKYMKAKMIARAEALADNNDITYEEIEEKIGNISFNGFEIFYNKDIIKSGERQLFMKKGEYGCYITVISMYAGNAEKTPDQMKENLDTIFQNYFFGV